MKSKDQYKRIVSILSSITSVFFLTVGFAIIWTVYYSNEIIYPYYRRGNWTLIAIYALLVYLFFKVYGAFKVGYLKRTDMFYSQIIAILCVNTVSYFLICLIARYFMPVAPILWMTVADVIFIPIWIFVSSKVYFKIFPPRQLVIVYGSKTAADLVYKMSLRIDKYIICESIRYDSNIGSIKHQIKRYEGVIICDIPPKERDELLRYCYQNSIRVYISPKVSDIILRGADDVRLFDTPLVVCRNQGLTFEQKLCKRIFDLILGCIALVILSPLMLIISICIKAYDGGSVFYKQERLTLDGKAFNVIKFRSMITDAEKSCGAKIADENDMRITPVGKFLRKFRLDEIPQLLNIIKGDMSLVGPRPERPEFYKEYSKDIPDFCFRLKVKAGLTGYAQVIGKYDTTPLDKLKMDLMYIENYSLIFDIQIVLMTIKTIFFPPEDNRVSKIPLHDISNQSKSNSDKVKKSKKYRS